MTREARVCTLTYILNLCGQSPESAAKDCHYPRSFFFFLVLVAVVVIVIVIVYT